jgi:hypothetical protein
VTLTQDALSVVAIAAAAVAVLALALVLILGRRLRKLWRYRPRPQPHHDQAPPAEPSGWDLQAIGYELAELREAVGAAVQRVGLVRFDAFEDMGGQLSFAAAMLDAEGTGIVFSSINGRVETRIYAKPVEHGTSRYNLSNEEEEAIRRALGAVRR